MVAFPPHPRPNAHKMMSTMPARVYCGILSPKVPSAAIRTGPIHSPKLAPFCDRDNKAEAFRDFPSVLRPGGLSEDESVWHVVAVREGRKRVYYYVDLVANGMERIIESNRMETLIYM